VSFRLVPKSVTLNDLERLDGLILRYFAELGRLQSPLCKSSWRYKYTFCEWNVAQKNLVLAAYHLCRYSQGVSPARALTWGDPLSLAKIWPIISHIWKRCKIGGKWSINHYRKSHIGFWLVPKSVTLNGVMAIIFALFRRIR